MGANVTLDSIKNASPWLTGAAVIAGLALLGYIVNSYLKKRQLEKEQEAVLIVRPSSNVQGNPHGNQQQQRQPQRRNLRTSPKRKEQQRVRFNVPGAQVAAVPSSEPVVVVAPPGTGPNPMNVYQSNLGQLGVGAEMEPATVPQNAGVPVDYAGSCEGANPNAVWQSTQLLPTNCGQTLEGTSDWELYAPSNYEVTNFLSAGYHLGTDTQQTSLKNANLQLRPEPIINKTLNCPWNISSYGESNYENFDWSHTLVA